MASLATPFSQGKGMEQHGVSAFFLLVLNYETTAMLACFSPD